MIIESGTDWLTLDTKHLGSRKMPPPQTDPRVIAALGSANSTGTIKSLLLVGNIGWCACTDSIQTVMNHYRYAWYDNEQWLAPVREMCAKQAGLTGKLPQVIVSQARAWWSPNPGAREPLYFAHPTIRLTGCNEAHTKLYFYLRGHPDVQGTITELATTQQLDKWLKIAVFADRLQDALMPYSQSKYKTLMAELGQPISSDYDHVKFLPELKQPQIKNPTIGKLWIHHERYVHHLSNKSLRLRGVDPDETFTNE
ncbi:hypothetical protein [Lacticaseibacillus jixiensis]|uniref:hypothetical protein n=1 Tax=Lacticaseibacillus jixiensis TaxID=3231926 RepID=UPI0036F1F19E